MNPLSSALTTIRRSPYQSLAAILILSLTFFVAYSFSFFLTGSEIVLRHFESRPQVIGFFKIKTPTGNINKVGEEIRVKEYVAGVKLISKEEALNIYREENKDDPLLLELVTAQILPASIEVSGKTIADLERIKKDLDSFAEIEEVVLQKDIIDSLALWTSTIRWVGVIMVIILSLVSFLIMLIVIGMKVVAKRSAIRIMRLIGATKWFVKSPFVFEGIIYGVVSSLIGWGLSFAGLLYLTPWLSSFLDSIRIFPIPVAFYAVQLSIGTLLGIFLGAVAGSVAVGRMIKK